jgi:hypothetical protein
MSGCAFRLAQKDGRSGLPKSLHRPAASSCTQGTPAGLPAGMPGMGEVMEGAMQQAAQPARQEVTRRQYM